jgi:arsenate reductase
MSKKICTVLFLCTGNSARSIMAEAILRQLAPARFIAYSAGSHPKGTVHPYALEVLRRHNYPAENLRSKSLHEFTAPDAPPIDFVFTLCDNAANEACPVWPGHPLMAHWGLPDPAVEGTEAARRLAFVETLHWLEQRLELLIHLPVAGLDRHSLQQRLAAIGTSTQNQA